MHEETLARFILIGETALVGALFLALPRFLRRGLLFGVYVGEEASESGRAREIRALWTKAGTIWLVLSLAVAATVAHLGKPPWSAILAVHLPIAGFFVLYLVCHRRARALRPERTAPPPAAATLVATPRGSSLLPAFVLAACVGLALAHFVYAIAAWPRLPERMPIHFGADGLPDGWSAKSAASVFLFPAIGFVMALTMGGATWLVSIAKRAVRTDDGGRSLAAQERFRTAMTRYLAGVALLAQFLMSGLGILSLEVALGSRAGLGAATWILLAGLLLWTFGGIVYLLVRVGQGGARLEGAASASALTDGLADDRHWKAGLLYYNPEDPSIFVEHRFGLGYTVNFGNGKAVAFVLFAVFAPLGLAVAAIVLLSGK